MKYAQNIILKKKKKKKERKKLLGIYNWDPWLCFLFLF